MLSHKSWKLEAILRLVLSIIVCVCAGSLAVGVVYYNGAPKNRLLFYNVAALSFVLMGFALALLRRPWGMDMALRRTALTLAVFYGGLVLAIFAGSFAGTIPEVPTVGQMVIAMLSVQGAALVLIAAFLRQQSITWTEAYGFQNNWKRAMLWGALVAFLFLPIAWAMQQTGAFALRHLPHLHLKPQEQLPVQTLEQASSWGERTVLGIVTILLAPAAEEAFFRGIVYPTIKQAGYPRLALWLTSLFFAAIHKNLIAFVPLLVLAILLTLLYEKFDNLLAPIAAHATFNAVNFALLYIAQSG
ncbi:MAG TPA: type II CAAX endopeptidase family protein [Verrucomicrobiae bacterium]|nr:type II CAAX endopeptidase family protein [Verrucomicrobiae bacterium]